jgi:hypothetical protein
MNHSFSHALNLVSEKEVAQVAGGSAECSIIISLPKDFSKPIPKPAPMPITMALYESGGDIGSI